MKVIIKIFIFGVPTILTQIGGIVYLFYLATNHFFAKITTSKLAARAIRLTYFFVLYSLTTFFTVPLIARAFGRVPLPIFETDHIRPLNMLTCLLNRNYVRPALKQVTFDVARQMNQKFPGTTLNYLDANFPFFNNFPLLPHLSHFDGKKLDFSFCYTDNKTSIATNKCPSFIGYGICEEPQKDETNTAAFCSECGYWQYSLLRKIIPQASKNDFTFNSEKTRELVIRFAAQPSIGKIFIEPHLKDRLQLITNKIRFHGCKAVRHDDHIHVQLQ